MSRWDEIVQATIADFRRQTVASKMHVFMDKFEEYKKLASEFQDEVEAMSSFAGRSAKLIKFLTLSDELTTFVNEWSRKNYHDLFGLCERLRYTIDDIDDANWVHTKGELEQAYKFLRAVCGTETKEVIFRMPHSLRAMMTDKDEEENITNHILLLKKLQKLRKGLPAARHCSTTSLNNLKAESVRCLQTVITETVQKFRNKIDRENSFGLYMLNKLMKEVFVLQRKPLGGETGEGIAVLTTFASKPDGWTGDLPPFFVTKSSNAIQQDQNSLLHEFTVGSCLNFLRTNTPGFMFTYGGFFCSGFTQAIDDLCQIVDKDTAITTLTMTEYIPGKPLSHYANSKYLADILKQVLWTLTIAGETMSFSHGDLHRENILVRKLDAPQKITYRFRDNSQEVIITDLVPQIIDFGKSRVAIKEKGANKQEEEKNEPTVFYFRRKTPGNMYMALEDLRGEFFPSFDWIRLLMSLSVVMNRPAEVLNFLLPEHKASAGLSKWVKSLNSKVEPFIMGLECRDAAKVELPKVHWW